MSAHKGYDIVTGKPDKAPGSVAEMNRALENSRPQEITVGFGSSRGSVAPSTSASESAWKSFNAGEAKKSVPGTSAGQPSGASTTGTKGK
jgi:hypothetical protein